MENKTTLSIKSKILFSLIGIPLIMLSILLIWSLKIFENDKMAYIFESSATVGNSISNQLSNQLKSYQQQAKLISTNIELTSEWKNKIVNFFSENETIDAILIFSTEKSLLAYFDRKKEISKFNIESNKLINQWLSEKEPKNDLLEFHESNGIGMIYIGVSNNSYKVLIGINDSELMSKVKKPYAFVVGLLDQSNKLILSTDGLNQKTKSKIPFLFESSPSTKLVKNKGGENYLMTYSPLTDFKQFTVATAIKKNEALEVLNSIARKSILIFIILLAISGIISILLTEGITSSLSDILITTKAIASGYFNVKTRIRKNDEVGAIAKSINVMVLEIKRLLKETEDKIRMEQELKLAQVLQSTFFPTSKTIYSNCHVIGTFESASECSGDWWYHFQHKGKLYFFIGDATGHGVSAALMTSTVFTAVKILFENEVEITEVVSKINSIIWKIYNGQILMTFLIAEFDPTTNNLKYVNASHEPAIFLRKTPEPLNKNQIEHLLENKGSRLGEKEISNYMFNELKLNVGDRIFFYTDGIFEIKNKKQKILSERSLNQFLIESHNECNSLDEFSEKFHTSIKNFQHQSSNDDLTFFMIEVVNSEIEVSKVG